MPDSAAKLVVIGQSLIVLLMFTTLLPFLVVLFLHWKPIPVLAYSWISSEETLSASCLSTFLTGPLVGTMWSSPLQPPHSTCLSTLRGSSICSSSTYKGKYWYADTTTSQPQPLWNNSPSSRKLRYHLSPPFSFCLVKILFLKNKYFSSFVPSWNPPQNRSCTVPSFL